MFLDSVLGGRRTVERQLYEPGQPGRRLEAFFGARTDGGVVTVAGALTLPAVYAAIRILADGVGTLPLSVYTNSTAGRKKAKESWQWELLHDRPNLEQTAPVAWSLLMTHLAAYGEGFLGKDFTEREGFPRNAVTGLWPIHPERIDVERLGGKKVYWLKDESGARRRRPFDDGQIIHIVGFTMDGMRGVSPINLGKRVIGAGLAMIAYTDTFYGNAALPSGLLTTDHELSDPAFDRLTRRWRSTYGGRRNAGKVAILEQGMSFQPIMQDQQKSQFVETSSLAIADVARLFRIPMSRLEANPQGGSLTYRNVEADDIYLVKHSLRPWMVKIEAALGTDRDLFPAQPREDMYAEFEPDALLRGSTKERYEAHSIAVGNKPWMRPSEVREMENLPLDEELDAEPEPQPIVVAPGEPAAKPPAKLKAVANSPVVVEQGGGGTVVHIPQQEPIRPPDIHVHVPPQPTPDVIVNVPQQPAPVVEVTAEVTVEQPKTKRKVRLERDGAGRLAGASVEEE